MDIKDLIEEEYEIQHYGFSSSSFIQQLLEMLTTNTDCILTEFEALIIQNVAEKDYEFYRQAIAKFKQEYKHVIVDVVNKYRGPISAHFTIPKHVLLPSDIHKVEFTKEKVDALKTEVVELEQEYIKQKAILSLYEEELRIASSLEPVEKKVNEIINKIQSEKEKGHDARLLQSYHEKVYNFEETFSIKLIDYIKYKFVKK